MYRITFHEKEIGMDEHIIEAAGKTRVVVRDGIVVSAEEPKISECPLALRFACPVYEMTSDAVSRNIQDRINSFGMCTKTRNLYSSDDFVGFGASELISSGLAARFIDAAVIVCDGAGTVVITDPKMVQGIGGRMSGLVSTSPIPEVIQKIIQGRGFVPDQKNASLDPVSGVIAAKEAGYKSLVVTISDPADAKRVRSVEPGAIIIAVHTTGYSIPDAQEAGENVDIITACASRAVWEVCGAKACLQAGSTVPVFALTKPGKQLILLRLADIDHPIHLYHSSLPVHGKKEPSPLI